MTTKTTTRTGLIAFLTGGIIVAGLFMSGKAYSDPPYTAGNNGSPRFSVRDIRGSYGMLETGKAEGQDFIEVAVVKADGAGHATIEAIETIGGQIGLKDTLTCTYTVTLNGLGEIF